MTTLPEAVPLFVEWDLPDMWPTNGGPSRQRQPVEWAVRTIEDYHRTGRTTYTPLPLPAVGDEVTVQAWRWNGHEYHDGLLRLRVAGTPRYRLREVGGPFGHRTQGISEIVIPCEVHPAELAAV